MTDSAPKAGEGTTSHVREIKWTGQITSRMVRPYIAWMNSVNQTLANEWRVKLMHVYQTGPGWSKAEVWVYEPDRPPKLERNI